jgi:hypothetical protein
VSRDKVTKSNVFSLLKESLVYLTRNIIENWKCNQLQRASTYDENVFGSGWFLVWTVICRQRPYLILLSCFAAQVPSPLVPKVRNPGDTSQFQDYPEDYSIFTIGSHNVHAKDFEDFWANSYFKVLGLGSFYFKTHFNRPNLLKQQ